MVLAVVDDLMLRSRVSSAAKVVSALVRFAASEDDAVARATEGATLIIVDLNGRRTNAVALVSRLKADPALASIRTIGFVSHVDTSTIDAARQAGIDDVLARSAFVTHLPDILAPHTQPRDTASS